MLNELILQDDAGNRSVDDEAVDAFVAKIGERVQRVRLQKAMSRRVLSELSGVSQRYLAQLEAGSGNISVGLLYKVSAALGHAPDRFLSDDDLCDPDTSKFLNLFAKATPAQRATVLESLGIGGEATVGGARRICLIGLRGAGKSSLGRLLASHLGTKFLELNAVIEAESGIPIGEVMALYGQEGYRSLERQAVDAVLSHETDVVLAVGGGIVSEPETFEFLLRNFRTVWLKATPEDHMQRVRNQGDERPMAGNPKAMEELKSILTNRESLYARADVMVDTGGHTLEDSCQDLIDAVEKLDIVGN